MLLSLGLQDTAVFCGSPSVLAGWDASRAPWLSTSYCNWKSGPRVLILGMIKPTMMLLRLWICIMKLYVLECDRPSVCCFGIEILVLYMDVPFQWSLIRCEWLIANLQALIFQSLILASKKLGLLVLMRTMSLNGCTVPMIGFFWRNVWLLTLARSFLPVSNFSQQTCGLALWRTVMLC